MSDNVLGTPNFDDVFLSADGTNFDGLSGFDTLVFAGSYNDYNIELLKTGNTKTVVTGEDGTVTETKWVEQFTFDDATFDVTTGEITYLLPNVSISDGQAVEGFGVRFALSLSEPSGEDVSVLVRTSQDTATGGVDFMGTGTTGTTVTIPAGETRFEFSIRTNDDQLDEGNEQFKVNILSADGATIADGQGTGTIRDNDPTTVTMSTYLGEGVAVEGDTITYQFQRFGYLGDELDVAWDYLPDLPSGAATVGVDFIDPASHDVHFDVGQDTAFLTFETNLDGVWEGVAPNLPSTEAFAISIVPSSNGSYTMGASGNNIATIIDADPPPPSAFF